MAPARRRLAGLAIAMVLLGAAAAATVGLKAARVQARKDEIAEAAEGTRSRAQDAIRAQLAVVEGRAVSSASR